MTLGKPRKLTSAQLSKNDKLRLNLSVIFILLALCCSSCSDANETAELSEADKRTGIRLTLEWGRLAPFPKSARDLVIAKTGNIFTRGVRVNFYAPKEDIALWVEESPGLKETQPKKEGSQRTYDIKPGGGAQHAEVVIDDSTNKVQVYVFWS